MSEVIAWPQGFGAGLGTQFWLQSNSLSSLQQATGTRSVYGPLAQRWMCNIPVTRSDRRDWLRMAAIFSRAGGISGLIRMWDPKRPHAWLNLTTKARRTTWGDFSAWDDGSLWADAPLPPYATVGAAETRGADSFIVAGLPASLSPALVAGDLIEIRPNGAYAPHGHLYECFTDAPTDASGMTRVIVSPPLRAGIAAGDQVVLQKPTSLFRMIDDDQGRLSHAGGGVASTGFSLMEELP